MPHTCGTVGQSQFRNSEPGNRGDISDEAPAHFPVEHLNFLFERHAGQQAIDLRLISLGVSAERGERSSALMSDRNSRNSGCGLFQKRATTYFLPHLVAHPIR
jgi:hypothetical protein